MQYNDVGIISTYLAYLPCVEKVTVSVDNGYCCDVLQLFVLKKERTMLKCLKKLKEK